MCVYKERILCSAVREKDNSSMFHCGYRHNNIYEQYGNDLLGHDFMNDMGFLTSNGRFVGREEAYRIAILAGQIQKRDYIKMSKLLGKDVEQGSMDWLASEDLY